MADKIEKAEQEWKEKLTPEQFHVAREKGTERAFTGAYWDHHDPGVYRCVCCDNELFRSEHKFDSGTGWPSFWQPADAANVGTEIDNGFYMRRTEALCKRCGAHLGHVFEEAPGPPGCAIASTRPRSSSTGNEAVRAALPEHGQADGYHR